MSLETAPELRLHSILLGVRDVDASARFYTDKLGLTLRGRFSDFALLQANGFTITLSGQLSRAKPNTGQHAVEIVLAVESVRDAYSRLRSKDVTFLNEPHTIDGTNDGVHFEDPDGHLFSLFGRP
jgi:catechol 2,3-dioxygenase-like lactoylglutathione lyase family enzyme